MAQAVAQWMQAQWAEELLLLAPRAYTIFEHSPSTVVPTFNVKLPGGASALHGLIAHLDCSSGRFFRAEIDVSVPQKDRLEVFAALGYTVRFQKSAAKQRIDYYVISKKE